MIDKWKKVVDNNKVSGALLTDLSKAFDCTCHDCTPYIVGDNTREVLILARKLFAWFANNKMKENHDKCHLLLSTQESFNIQMANFTINLLR